MPRGFVISYSRRFCYGYGLLSEHFIISLRLLHLKLGQPFFPKKTHLASDQSYTKRTKMESISLLPFAFAVALLMCKEVKVVIHQVGF